MTRRKRNLLIAAAVVVALLILAPAALAAAGGGSAGFGGGGGEGGGGGGGRGVGFYILIQLLIRIAVLGHGLGALVLIALAIAYLVMTRMFPEATRFWSAQNSKGRAQRRRVAERQRRVSAAAAEAAEDDAAFAADAVKVNAAALFKQVQAAWDRGDRARLEQLVGPKLAGEWDRRLDDLDRRGWRNRVQIIGEPQVDYVGLNHTGDKTDTVTVRIEAKLRDYVEDRMGNHVKRAGHLSETVHLREFWTIGRKNNRWVVVSIEQGAEGMHAIDDAIIATTWSDNTALRDQALIEGAVQDSVPHGMNIAELADLDYKGDAHAAALDLSLADGRFAPDVLEVTARRAVTAWAEAVDGDASRLTSIAHGQAVRDLLHPGDPSQKTRLVVRGPHVNAIRITGLNAAAQPPTMSVEVDIQGRRYIEDRATTAVLAGSPSHETKFTEHWTFALDGDSRQPWLLAAAS